MKLRVGILKEFCYVCAGHQELSFVYETLNNVFLKIFLTNEG